MLIDVQDAGLNYVLNGCLLAIAAVTLASLFPWRLAGGRNRWTVFLPWLALAIYVGYEFAMPARMNIRLDLLLVWPMLCVAFVAWAVRALRIRWLRRNRA